MISNLLQLLPHASKVLFLALSVIGFSFYCESIISGIAEQICAKFTWKTCLVPYSETSLNVKVRGHGHKKNALCTPITLPSPPPPGSDEMERARCKERHAAAHGTVASLLGVISAACLRSMFGRTSLALVLKLLLCNSIRIVNNANFTSDFITFNKEIIFLKFRFLTLSVVLLRFQNVCCRSISVGFAEKTAVFGSV